MTEKRKPTSKNYQSNRRAARQRVEKWKDLPIYAIGVSACFDKHPLEHHMLHGLVGGIDFFDHHRDWVFGFIYLGIYFIYFSGGQAYWSPLGFITRNVM